MKKINVSKSLIFGDKIEDLKKSFEYLNGEGFFSNYKDFSDYKDGILKMIKVSDDSGYPYVNKYNSNGFDYFIPKSKAVFESEEPEKYYKPFKTVGELLDSTEVVKYLKFRSKSGDTYNLAYNGYEIDKFGTIYIHLGSLTFTLQELFNSYEYSDDTQWLPFGVECEKDEAEYM